MARSALQHVQSTSFKSPSSVPTTESRSRTATTPVHAEMVFCNCEPARIVYVVLDTINDRNLFF